MKKLLLTITIASFLISCSKSPVEETILKYEQTIDGTFTDLKMKIESLEQTGTITVDDSLKLLNKELNVIWFGSDATPQDTLTFKYVLAEMDSSLILQKQLVDLYKDAGELLKEFDANEKLDSFKEMYNNASTLSQLNDKYKSLSKETTLSNKYECTYKIHNPFLDAEQTISKRYIISPDGMKVQSSEQIKE